MNDELEIIEEDGRDEAKTKIDKLKRELDVCHKEKEDYLSGWQRAKADYINYKKDEERRVEEFVKFSGLAIFKEMLGVADSLEKAAMHSGDEGVRNTYTQLTGFLEKFGIKKIDTTNQIFDPAHHEAVIEESVVDAALDNKIIEELQAGYMIHDRVLRPARVKVGVYKHSI
ncbi:MAG: nucleotide exchange factor GrpE [Patescibacteria group bacterium]